MLRSKYASPETPTEVELTFSNEGKTYKIKRNPTYERTKLRGTGTTEKKADAELLMPDGKIITGTKEVDEKIRDILGVDKDQFCQIAMIAQGEFRELLLADTETRRKIFQKIFNTNLYSLFQKEVKEDFLRSVARLKEGGNSFKQYAAGIVLPEDTEFPPENELSEFLAGLLKADRAQDDAWEKELAEIGKKLDTLTADAAKAAVDEENRSELRKAKLSLAEAEKAVSESGIALEKEKACEPELVKLAEALKALEDERKAHDELMDTEKKAAAAEKTADDAALHQLEVSRDGGSTFRGGRRRIPCACRLCGESRSFNRKRPFSPNISTTYGSMKRPFRRLQSAKMRRTPRAMPIRGRGAKKSIFSPRRRSYGEDSTTSRRGCWPPRFTRANPAPSAAR